MKKILCGVCFVGVLLSSVPLQAADSARNVKVVTWTDEKDQSGGIDLLQQAAKNEARTTQNTGGISTPIQLQAPVNTQETKTSTATATSVSGTPSQKESSQATTSAKQAASSATTLDIPLEMGTTSNVQTTVKPLSPSSAQRVEKARQKLAEQKAAGQDSSSTAIAQSGEADAAAEAEEEAAADAELEYAVRMLEKSKQEATAGRTIPPPAAKNKTATVPAANKRFNPNAFRPGVDWMLTKSNHFDIYTQRSTAGVIGSSNMALSFESAYQTLRRFIPWMMSNRVRVFVYQDHNSYLRYEPEAKAWTRAVAYPTRGEIVVYDEPGHQQELKESFTHELTHIFTQNFFDKHKTGRIMTPTWLDEGLAVLVEDQAYNGEKGGPWNHDFQTLNLQRDPSQEMTPFSSKSMFGSFGGRPSFIPGKRGNGRLGFGRRGAPVHLTPFEDFMQEGSLEVAEGKNKLQKWYLQAYLMVRFLLNPSGGRTPSNRMQFEQFTRLIAEGEMKRNPSTGFVMKDAKGKAIYQPYDVEKALGRAYHYNTAANFEDNFWRWVNK